MEDGDDRQAQERVALPPSPAALLRTLLVGRSLRSLWWGAATGLGLRLTWRNRRERSRQTTAIEILEGMVGSLHGVVMHAQAPAAHPNR